MHVTEITKEQLLIAREIMLELEKHYPSTFDKILLKLDISDDTFLGTLNAFTKDTS